MLLVANASHHGQWNVGFRRTFGQVEANKWALLLASFRSHFRILRIVWRGRLRPLGVLRLVLYIGTYLEVPLCHGPPNCEGPDAVED